MSEEIWKPIPEANGRYEVSSFGRIRSVTREQEFRARRPYTRLVQGAILSTTPDKDGYPRVALWLSAGVRVTFQLHNLVCRAFCGEPNALHTEIGHLDGNRGNARADNLKWVGRVENHSHRRAHGTDPAGERHPSAKLTEAKVRAIRARPATAKTMADTYGVSVHTIYDVLERRRWAHI